MKHLFLVMLYLLHAGISFAAKIYTVNNQIDLIKAASIALPGDEIIIANGNYSNWETVINTKGTAGKPIIIRAESTGKVTFSGDINKPLFQITGSYTEISGITFTGCNVFKAQGGFLIELKNAKNCRITNCIFRKTSLKINLCQSS